MRSTHGNGGGAPCASYPFYALQSGRRVECGRSECRLACAGLQGEVFGDSGVKILDTVDPSLNRRGMGFRLF